MSSYLSPSFYQAQWKNFMQNSYNYYHPAMKRGSPAMLWHSMMVVSAVMYTTSYIAHHGKTIQHQHDVEKQAMEEYYEKHGGSPGHH